jgi:NADPH:quinone reductase
LPECATPLFRDGACLIAAIGVVRSGKIGMRSRSVHTLGGIHPADCDMKAWQAHSFSGLDALRLVDTPIPKPAAGEVLVKMRAAGVVTFDWAILHGALDPSFPPISAPLILGNQGMGEIADPGDCDFRKGERVMFAQFAYGFSRPGSWAEYVCVEAAHIGRVPDEMSDEVAANLPSSYPTAYLALEAAGFAPGKSVLTTGIGGSVGNAAYQLARALGASKVFSTAGSADKAQRAKQAGFDGVIDISSQSIGEGLRAINGGENVDIVIETIGGDVLAQAVSCVTRQGVVITLGFTAGDRTTIKLMELVLMSSRLEGFGVYSRSYEQWQHAYTKIARLLREKRIAPLTARAYPFAEAPEAVCHLVQDRPFGTVALML